MTASARLMGKAVGFPYVDGAFHICHGCNWLQMKYLVFSFSFHLLVQFSDLSFIGP